jgi:hypothetical protein
MSNFYEQHCNKEETWKPPNLHGLKSLVISKEVEMGFET